MSVVITAKGFYVEATAHFRFWQILLQKSVAGFFGQ